MEENNIEENPVDTQGGITFLSESDVERIQSEGVVEPVAEEVVEEETPETTEEPTTEETPEEVVQETEELPAEEETVEDPTEEKEFHASTDDYEEEDSNDNDTTAVEVTDDLILQRLSEKLGKEVKDFSELSQSHGDIDERLQPIVDFMNETGRSIKDWVAYQQLNPSEMDDITAIQVQMASDNPALSREEITYLLSNRYKLSPDEYSEDEVKLSRIQLKADAGVAKGKIAKIQESYKVPMDTSAGSEEVSEVNQFDEDWVSSSKEIVNDAKKIEFDLGDNGKFSFGIGDKYKQSLTGKLSNPDEFFFGHYLSDDDSWDQDRMVRDRTVLDNFPSIVKAIYQKGIGDGEKRNVKRAANVQTKTPKGTTQPKPDIVTQQLRDIFSDK